MTSAPKKAPHLLTPALSFPVLMMAVIRAMFLILTGARIQVEEVLITAHPMPVSIGLILAKLPI